MAGRWVLLFSIAGIALISSPADSAWFKVRQGPGARVALQSQRHLGRVAEERAFYIVTVARDQLSREQLFLDGLMEPGRSFSPEPILGALKQRASEIASEQVKADPSWSFEVLTGKLTTSASAKVGTGEVKLGEANIYKIIGLLAAPIAACATIKLMDERVECVRQAIRLVKDVKIGGKPVMPVIHE
jgi:hypothetical protein